MSRIIYSIEDTDGDGIETVLVLVIRYPQSSGPYPKRGLGGSDLSIESFSISSTKLRGHGA